MPEHVVGYNRWYEDDHMITGATSMPWMFSCRRFVAPRWLQHLRAPADSRVAVSLRFDPRPLPPDKLGHVREPEAVDRRITVLHFLECDPRSVWAERFADAAERIAAGGFGSLAIQAALVPTRHGTDAYTDELF